MHGLMNVNQLIKKYHLEMSYHFELNDYEIFLIV